MIIVVDGYNLLKHIFPSDKKAFEKQRQSFIRQLAYYKHKKQSEIKDMIIVFDAGPERHATREVKSDVVIIFAGQKTSADTWITDYTKRHKGQEIVVVTTDKALSSACQLQGATVIRSADFYTLVHNCLREDIYAKQEAQQADSNYDLHKFKDLNMIVHELDELDKLDSNTHINKQALDLLMEEASCSLSNNNSKNFKETNTYEKTHTKGNSQTLSKKEKHQLAKLKKLK